MNELVPSPLEAWGNFYVIVGSSAGALTGLQFVVMTLIAQSGPTRARGETISAFGTPNVVHFCAALLASAVVAIPWGALRQAGVVVAVVGALGVFYAVVVTRRAHRQRGYTPVFEDWLWHNILPALAYASLLVAGVTLDQDATHMLFVIAGAVLLLVFIGIHNAWDTVTYLTMLGSARSSDVEPRAGGGADPPAGGGQEPRAGGGATPPGGTSSAG